MTVYTALDHRFRVSCDHAGLSAWLDQVLASLAVSSPGEARHYRLIVDRPPPGPYELWFEGRCLVRSARPARPYAYLFHHMNRMANRLTAARATILHSAAAATDEGTILFPAPMEAGKSTLVTSLTGRGFRYLTDELVALDPHDGRVSSYPRPISLDPGSWPLFPELAPAVDVDVQRFLPAQWHVPPPRVGTVASAVTTPVAVVVHHYQAGAATSWTDLDPVMCLRQLIGCCFSFDDHTERDLTTLARLIDHASCSQLVVGDLTEAADLLAARFGVAATPRP